jgi:hypothetical protein
LVAPLRGGFFLPEASSWERGECVIKASEGLGLLYMNQRRRRRKCTVFNTTTQGYQCRFSAATREGAREEKSKKKWPQ